MVNKAKVQSVIESAFLSAVDELISKKGDDCYGDLYVQASAETGELRIYDDGNVLVGKAAVYEWTGAPCEDEWFTRKVTADLKAALASLETKKVFDNPRFLKPFSISLTDDEFAVIEELLFIDDENLCLGEPLMKDLDADLDDFLNKLLSDVK